jgi:adenosylcobyric acid synthase
VPILPHISNFDDLDPLDMEETVELVRVRPGQTIPADCALVLLCGSKSTIADLEVLKKSGLDIDIKSHVRRGGYVLGLCGGYQMLGNTIADPKGIEGPPATVEGLGLLDADTVLTGDKRLASVTGSSFDGTSFSGYEMHVGITTGKDCDRPFSSVDDHIEGAISPAGRVLGTYIHGLFADDRQRGVWLERLGGSSSALNYEQQVDEVLDRLAAHMETHLDLDRLLAIAR